MLGIHHYWLFIATAVLLIITPGQDTFFILGRSIASGRTAGLAAALGISAGTVVHTCAAALGLSALLATSPYAFMAVKFAGAAYLLWIGVRALLARSGGLPVAAAGDQDDGRWSAFRQGIVTNVLNPKVALFFLAFVPQFIAPETPNKALAFILLGALFNINSIPVNSGWALAAAWMAKRAAVQRGMHWLDRVAGAMFVGFGVKLALSEGPSR